MTESTDETDQTGSADQQDQRIRAALVLATARELYPELVRAQAQARLDLAAAVLAYDRAHAEHDGDDRYTLAEQAAIEQASAGYVRALADLVRGEQG